MIKELESLFGMSANIPLIKMINIHTMKNLILLFSFLAIVSCNGQTDLESLKFDEKVSDNITKEKKETEANYGLLSYKQADVKTISWELYHFLNIPYPKDMIIPITTLRFCKLLPE